MEASLGRDDIIRTIRGALEPLPAVYAGWEGGSAAFEALDRYSDIDINFLVDPAASTDEIFAVADAALERISAIAACYHEPPGIWTGMTHRYYRLADADEYLLIDFGLLRADAPDYFLDAERHGKAIRLFDKGDWLRPRAFDAAGVQARADKRYAELQTWFPMSQNFVVKSILRDDVVEATSRYWGMTLRPLVELLRMRDCPNRWDFGMRYLERDLAPEAYERMRRLVFVADLADLREKHAEAAAWGDALLASLARRPLERA